MFLPPHLIDLYDVAEIPVGSAPFLDIFPVVNIDGV